jgi:hypothetical protein
MSSSRPVDAYKIQLLASSVLSNRLTPDEFQQECHRLTDTERRALYERVEELRRGQRL